MAAPPPTASGANPVDADKIVREQIKRELQAQRLTETFAFNPKTTFHITEKPNYVTQELYENDDAVDRDLLASATMVAKAPREKYDFPMTEAQEIGWQSGTPLMKPSPRFMFRSRQSEMTKHANAVWSSPSMVRK
eukprot:c25731_g1_i1.p1 GENE.c25731_g1_i1~~c25731_g1_i1.p1  ORF type:complete len:149 (+),score=37.13 c25731_g1_i1:43-447(+)